MAVAGDRLETIIRPYLEIEGVLAAALISSDGLLVSSSGDGVYNFEALAAIASGTVASAASIASELPAGSLRLAALDLHGTGLILAPLSGELVLMLIGGPDILGLACDGGSGQGLAGSA